MIQSKTDFKYSNTLIIWVCENYETLSNGKMPDSKDDYGTVISTSRAANGSFIKPCELVSDIDRAIKELKPTEKGVIIGRLIDGWSTEHVACWYGFNTWLDVQNIEQYAVRKMKRYLNGEHND